MQYILFLCLKSGNDIPIKKAVRKLNNEKR